MSQKIPDTSSKNVAVLETYGPKYKISNIRFSTKSLIFKFLAKNPIVKFSDTNQNYYVGNYLTQSHITSMITIRKKRHQLRGKGEAGPRHISVVKSHYFRIAGFEKNGNNHVLIISSPSASILKIFETQ